MNKNESINNFTKDLDNLLNKYEDSMEIWEIGGIMTAFCSSLWPKMRIKEVKKQQKEVIHE